MMVWIVPFSLQQQLQRLHVPFDRSSDDLLFEILSDRFSRQGNLAFLLGRN